MVLLGATMCRTNPFADSRIDIRHPRLATGTCSRRFLFSLDGNDKCLGLSWQYEVFVGIRFQIETTYLSESNPVSTPACWSLAM
jgi:hypothetical protein